MGYNKLILSGSVAELYQYEKNIIFIGRRKSKIKGYKSSSDLSFNGEDSGTAEVQKKRRDNARRACMVFRRLVLSNLQPADLPLLVTITYADLQPDLRVGWADYKSFIKALRYKFGGGFKYICVPEFQKRGAVHFHALFWGLPKELFLQERKTRTLAKIWSRGYIFLKQTDGNEKLSSYLTKYMAKAFEDPRLAGQKGFVASRNVSRPRIFSAVDNIDFIVDDYCGVDNFPILRREYDTLYLGRCVYKKYNVKI